MPGQIGNKGGGRKSAYQELKDAQRLWAIWTMPGMAEKIRKKVEDGTASLEERFIHRAFDGLDGRDSKIFNKLYPDNLKLSGDLENPIRFLKVEKMDGNNDTPAS